MNFSKICFLCTSVMFIACSSNEPSNPDGDTTTGGSTSSTGGNAQGGGGSSTGGQTTGGSGGSDGGSGGEGGAGGSGGSPPVGPCDAIEADALAVIFTAPAEHADGAVAIAGFVQCAPGSEAVCTPVSWSDPYVGCVAPADVDTVTCLFGARPAGTEIHYIAGVDTGNTPALDVWFSWLVGDDITKLGTHIVCRGTEVIGGYDGNSFFGALSDTDEANKANQMITVP